MNRRLSECSMAESAGTLVQLQPLGTVPCKALWLSLAVLWACTTSCAGTGEAGGEPHPSQVHLHHGVWLGLQEPPGPATGPATLEGSGCVSEGAGAEQLRNQTSDRLETVILGITKTESMTVTTQWVKEHVGDRDTTHMSLCLFIYWEDPQGVSIFKALILPRNWCRFFQSLSPDAHCRPVL